MCATKIQHLFDQIVAYEQTEPLLAAFDAQVVAAPPAASQEYSFARLSDGSFSTEGTAVPDEQQPVAASEEAAVSMITEADEPLVREPPPSPLQPPAPTPVPLPPDESRPPSGSSLARPIEAQEGPMVLMVPWFYGLARQGLSPSAT